MRNLLLFCVTLLLSTVCSAASYTYDNLGRLTEVAYDDGSKISYAYDAASNLTSMAQLTN